MARRWAAVAQFVCDHTFPKRVELGGLPSFTDLSIRTIASKRCHRHLSFIHGVPPDASLYHNKVVCCGMDCSSPLGVMWASQRTDSGLLSARSLAIRQHRMRLTNAITMRRAASLRELE